MTTDGARFSEGGETRAHLAQMQAEYEKAQQNLQRGTAPSVDPALAAVERERLARMPAGQYVLVAELFDQPLSEPGEEFRFKRHRRGDVVTLTAPEARRLLGCGAVIESEDPQRAAYASALDAYRRARDTEERLAELPPVKEPREG